MLIITGEEVNRYQRAIQLITDTPSIIVRAVTSLSVSAQSASPAAAAAAAAAERQKSSVQSVSEQQTDTNRYSERTGVSDKTPLPRVENTERKRVQFD